MNPEERRALGSNSSIHNTYDCCNMCVTVVFWEDRVFGEDRQAQLKFEYSEKTINIQSIFHFIFDITKQRQITYKGEDGPNY